jgi:hypothetical protein
MAFGSFSQFFVLLSALLVAWPIARAEGEPENECVQSYGDLARKGAAAAEVALTEKESALKTLSALPLGSFHSPADVEAALRTWVNGAASNGFVDARDFPNWKQDFWAYWAKNRQQLLSPASLKKWNSITLDTLGAYVWMGALGSQPSSIAAQKVLKWLPGFLMNSRAQKIFGGVRTVVSYTAGKFLVGVAGGISFAIYNKPSVAFMDPVINPIAEYLTVEGKKVMGPLSSELTKLLNGGGDAEVSKKKSRDAVGDLEKLRTFLEGIGQPGDSPEKVNEQLESFGRQWVNMVQLIQANYTANVRLGRGFAIDTQIGNPEGLNRDITGFNTASEIFHNGVEHAYDRIMGARRQMIEDVRDASSDQLHLAELGRTGKKGEHAQDDGKKIVAAKQAKIDAIQKETRDIDGMIGQLLDTEKQKMQADYLKKEAERAEKTAQVVKLRQALVEKGVEGKVLDELLEQEESMLISANQTATMLALASLYDEQLPEENRLLPQGAFSAWKDTNRNLGRDFFQKKYKERMAEEIERIKGQLQADIDKEESQSFGAKAAALRALSGHLLRKQSGTGSVSP